MNLQPQQTLRLHVAGDGNVWYGVDTRLGDNSKLCAELFVSHYADLLANCDTMRVLGTAENAPLITRLHEWRIPQGDRRRSLLVASPAIVPTHRERLQASSVLRAMWTAARTRTAWYELTEKEYPTYAMIVARRERKPSDLVRRIARVHPAWPAISFVTDKNLDAAAGLLCDIVDPRWYRHPYRPNRLTRLLAFMGLTAENMLAALGEGPPGRNFERARNAVAVWYPSNGERGSDFLFERFAKHASKVGGLLAATRRLVEFVSLVWLTTVSPPHREVFFDGRAFFKANLALDYERHRATQKLLA